jgi:superfamily II DNA or RNA helicase
MFSITENDLFRQVLDSLPLDFQLRTYQLATLERLLERLFSQRGPGKAKFVWPTGAGKTLGFVILARLVRASLPHAKILIIAQRDKLLSQAAKVYQRIEPGIRVGRIGGGYEEWDAPVTVASIQALCRPQRIARLAQERYRLVIVDECHHALPTNDYGLVLGELKEAHIVGCTATDQRLDGCSNTDLFGEAVYTLPLIEAIEQAYLTDVRARAISTGTRLDGIGFDKTGEFQARQLAHRLDTPWRNAQVVRAFLAHGEARQTLCFTASVAHAQHLAEAFRHQGITASAISGSTPKEEQDRILSDFEAGRLRVLCNCDLLTEGYDAVSTYSEALQRYIYLSCIILAMPMMSPVEFLQCVGRALRPAPTKKDALILYTVDAGDAYENPQRQPQSLAKVTGLSLMDGESVLEGLQRQRREEAEAHKRHAPMLRAERSSVFTCHDPVRCAEKAAAHRRYLERVLPQACEQYEELITSGQWWLDIPEQVFWNMRKQGIEPSLLAQAVEEILEVYQPVEWYQEQGQTPYKILVTGESERLGGRPLAVACRYGERPQTPKQVWPIKVLAVFDPSERRHQWADASYTQRICYCPVSLAGQQKPAEISLLHRSDQIPVRAFAS